jgi:hypothetical protein
VSEFGEVAAACPPEDGLESKEGRVAFCCIIWLKPTSIISIVILLENIQVTYLIIVP